jgi:ketosteroid isomerase-like protein
MDNQNNGQLAQQFIDALHRLEGDDRDLDGIVRLFAEDAQLTNAALALAGEERRGQEGVRRFWKEYRATFEQAQSDFHQVTLGDQTAGLFWTTTGTGNDGQPLAYDGVSLLIFGDDGKITQFRGYYDTRQLTRTVGAGS